MTHDSRPVWRSYLTHLECTACGLRHDADQLQTVCTACGKVLFARYDLNSIRQAVMPREFASRRWDMWRYWELMPVRDAANVISLGEGLTPLVRVRKEATRKLGFERGQLELKDEGLNPTASFKARGLSAAISRARELGARSIALPSAGNAGSAAAAYAAAGGLEAAVEGLKRSVAEHEAERQTVLKAIFSLNNEIGRLARDRPDIRPVSRTARPLSAGPAIGPGASPNP